MPEPLTSVVVIGFAGAFSSELGRQSAVRVVETLDTQAEKGWGRDKKAGGISSWGSENKPQAKPA
jgi:hypothetical protein